MSTHRKHLLKNETYFITFTCHEWIPLFQITNIYTYFNKWFNYLIDQKTYLLGYVIIPNHFHGLIHLPDECTKDPNLLISNGKRFLSYEIIRRLEGSSNLRLLNKLKSAVATNEIKKAKKHQVFKPSFDAKICYHREMLETKLDYIHHNPVTGKWSLINDWAEYPFSSAPFYTKDKPHPHVTHYKAIWV